MPHGNKTADELRSTLMARFNRWFKRMFFLTPPTFVKFNPVVKPHQFERFEFDEVLY